MPPVGVFFIIGLNPGELSVHSLVRQKRAWKERVGAGIMEPYNPSEEDRVSEDILNVSDASFEEEVLKSEIPVLVDFWAVWCGPCRMVAPSVESMAQEYQGKLKVVKVNVDENQAVPAKYGIMSIPTLLLFKAGELQETIIGAMPKGKIVEAVAKHL